MKLTQFRNIRNLFAQTQIFVCLSIFFSPSLRENHIESCFLPSFWCLVEGRRSREERGEAVSLHLFSILLASSSHSLSTSPPTPSLLPGPFQLIHCCCCSCCFYWWFSWFIIVVVIVIIHEETTYVCGHVGWRARKRRWFEGTAGIIVGQVTFTAVLTRYSEKIINTHTHTHTHKDKGVLWRHSF